MSYQLQKAFLKLPASTQKSRATRVTDVSLVIGRLSSIVDDSVSFYWDVISKDTLCEGAKLHFRRFRQKWFVSIVGKNIH